MSTSTFRAAVVRTPGGPDSIELIDVPVAEPGPGEVRVQIAAAAVNPVDLAVAGGVFHAMGLVSQPDHTGLGWDFAGTVVATGPGADLAAGLVDGFDRDFGTYAEQLIVPASSLADAAERNAARTLPHSSRPPCDRVPHARLARRRGRRRAGGVAAAPSRRSAR